MSKGYEAHITFDREHGPRVEEMAKTRVFGWKYSQIDGDPVLGKKVYCYLTAHEANGDVMKDRLDFTVRQMRAAGIPPVRAKIEHIIYDERF